MNLHIILSKFSKFNLQTFINNRPYPSDSFGLLSFTRGRNILICAKSKPVHISPSLMPSIELAIAHIHFSRLLDWIIITYRSIDRTYETMKHYYNISHASVNIYIHTFILMGMCTSANLLHAFDTSSTPIISSRTGRCQDSV